MIFKPLVWLWVVVLLSLTGCGAMTHTVEVPVAVPCHVPDIPRPAFAIDTVPPDADVFVVARALWATVEQWEAYEMEMRAAIDACK